MYSGAVPRCHSFHRYLLGHRQDITHVMIASIHSYKLYLSTLNDRTLASFIIVCVLFYWEFVCNIIMMDNCKRMFNYPNIRLIIPTDTASLQHPTAGQRPPCLSNQIILHTNTCWLDRPCPVRSVIVKPVKIKEALNVLKFCNFLRIFLIFFIRKNLLQIVRNTEKKELAKSV